MPRAERRRQGSCFPQRPLTSGRPVASDPDRQLGRARLVVPTRRTLRESWLLEERLNFQLSFQVLQHGRVETRAK
jgi:hypothetical protein